MIIYGIKWRITLQLFATACSSASSIIKLFLPLFLYETYGSDFVVIAWLMAAYGAGCMVGAYAGGIYSDVISSQWIAGSTLFLSGIFSVFLSQLLPLFWLWVAIPLVGFFDGAFRPVNLRLVMDACPKHLQVRMQGVHRVMFNVGVALAGLTAGALLTYGYEYIFLFQGALNVFCSLGLIGYAVKNSETLRVAGSDIKINAHPLPPSVGDSPWKDPTFLLFIVGQLLALGIFDQMYGTFGIFLQDTTISGPEWIGYLFSINAVLIVILQMPVARWIERHGRVVAARLGVVFLGCAFLFLNAGTHIGWSVITLLFITAAELLLTPVWALAVLARAEHRQKGKYVGIFSAAWLGHSLYGPSVGTWVYGVYGGPTLWWVCAAAGAVVFVLHYSTVGRLSNERASGSRSFV